MKGVIFNQLEAMVGETFGIEAWDAILERATLKTADGVFLSPMVYPDEDLFALVGAASELTGKPAGELVRAFGRYLFPKLAALAPFFLKPGMTAKSFLLSVDRVIHVEVRKLHSGAVLPMIGYEDPAPDRLVILYSSPRRLCVLAMGLIEGVAAHFAEEVTVTETACIKEGAEACRLECSFRVS